MAMIRIMSKELSPEQIPDTLSAGTIGIWGAVSWPLGVLIA